MCGRYTLTTPAGMGLPDRFGVPDEPDAATLERYNVCPTEQIAVVSAKEGERKMRSVRWGLVPVVGARARQGPRADQRAQRDGRGDEDVRGPVRAPRPPLPRARRRLVRVAALREPQAAADPVPLHGRRRRAVRVRRAVRLREDRRGLGHVGDDPHHHRQRRSARPSTTGCRSCSPGPTRRRRGWRAPTTPSCSRRSPTRAPPRGPPTRPSTAPGWRGRS